MVDNPQDALGFGGLDGVIKGGGQVKQNQCRTIDADTDDMPGIAVDDGKDNQQNQAGNSQQRTDAMSYGVCNFVDYCYSPVVFHCR
jgi:hypothetical protein